MLFSSYPFLFAFLPFTLIAFYLVARINKASGMIVLTLASLGFYAVWRPAQTWVLLASILINYVLGRQIQRTRLDRPRHAKLLLWLGLLIDLGALFYFKYTMFFVASINDAAGTDIVLQTIILPLGISFFTFQKIAYLVDSARGEATATGFVEFSLFASFFPQLIAGPIAHYGEIIPQFRNRLFGRLQPRNLMIGLTIFAIGLFKKMVIADAVAAYLIPMYRAAAEHGAVDMRTGWLIAVSWTLQVYFDFSGYSDMAIGLARMFGVQLPLNFHSPLRAASVIDYWRRWHMSLQRFILTYVYQPLALPMNRLVAQHRLIGWPAFALAIAVPAFVTFFLLGVWHGAGWGFVVYGVLNAVYVTVNEAWRERRKRLKRALQKQKLPVPQLNTGDRVFYHALTLACVFTGNMFFRAETLRDGIAIFRGMWALNGVGTSVFYAPFADPALFVLLGISAAIVTFAPNTQQIMQRYRPAVNWSKWRSVGQPMFAWRWRPKLPKLAYAGITLSLGIIFIERGSKIFVYFNF